MRSTVCRSWLRWPATRPEPRSGRAGPRSSRPPSTRRCGAPTGCTSTASWPSGAQSSSASQEANALALAYGVVPAADSARVGAYVAGLGVHLGPNHGLELLRGLTAAGMPDAVVRTLTDASIPGWAHIVAAGGTFTWEVWSPSDLIGDSMSHGWGSSALVAMQETLLGVTFGAPNPDGTRASPWRLPSGGCPVRRAPCRRSRARWPSTGGGTGGAWRSI